MQVQRFALAVVVGVVTPAFGQSFNVDVGDPNSPFGVPSDLYGAGAGQSGTWNAVSSGAFNVPLSDLAGAATGVTLTNIGGLLNLDSNNPGTSGGDQALMDDFQDVGGAGALATWTFSSLANGSYTVYTYAWAPDNAAFVSEVTVPGSPDPPQLIGGAWPGGQVQGITYALHTVDVVDGSLAVMVGTSVSFGTVNGFQLVGGAGDPCPWDLDGNGDVGILDLLALLAAWGTDPGGPPDFNGDGDVGILDLLTLLANWGACP
ncbi:MAG: hypothetical protein IH988_04260 [Planctomycetes bacterium]|nr:hypothetical protein [Planctomycetota bacterium]